MWYAPLLIGLAGSLHCIGMCGPLTSLVTKGGRNIWWKRVIYNVGRIFTYGLLGAFVSFLGGFAFIGGIQAWVSFGVGLLLLVVGIAGIQVAPPLAISRPLAMLSGFLKRKFGVFLAMKNPCGIFGMGLINGLLPCGMTWLALGYCVTLQWPLDGFVAMLLFGLGTVPVMIGFPGLLHQLTTRLNFSFRRIQTVLLIVSGCILIFRSAGEVQDMQKNTDEGIVICRTH